MFLTNELLATSKRAFVALVRLLVARMRPGACLLVVDSAGSFSEVAVGAGGGGGSGGGGGGAEAPRKYMVYTLLDAVGAFEVLEQTDSRWYRFPDGLAYPLKLNNMRYFMRLYRRR
ncbi:hypothetical protein DFJ73DRAFT_852410 [Zopfochytrium polystomum]|nr:hypothetical protein DFJ73DRAFT_852410 [Zopfochytrium polystomum]